MLWANGKEPKFCYLTTAGRVTEREHTVEMWFASQDWKVFVLSGAGRRSDWVKNLLHEPQVRMSFGLLEFSGRARLVSNIEEDRLSRKLLLEKYGSCGEELVQWARESLPIVVELDQISAL